MPSHLEHAGLHLRFRYGPRVALRQAPHCGRVPPLPRRLSAPWAGVPQRSRHPHVALTRHAPQTARRPTAPRGPLLREVRRWGARAHRVGRRHQRQNLEIMILRI
jgi:hypothetical protein